jgi:hypothetical protein
MHRYLWSYLCGLVCLAGERVGTHKYCDSIHLFATTNAAMITITSPIQYIYKGGVQDSVRPNVLTVIFVVGVPGLVKISYCDHVTDRSESLQGRVTSGDEPRLSANDAGLLHMLRYIFHTS